jgi:hypothetical protein
MRVKEKMESVGLRIEMRDPLVSQLSSECRSVLYEKLTGPLRGRLGQAFLAPLRDAIQREGAYSGKFDETEGWR